MYNLYFPICAFLSSILIVIAFYTKKRITNEDTKCYSKLILLGLSESTLACIIVIMAIALGTTSIAYFTNKLDYILILFWIWYLFSYVLSISADRKDIIDKIIKGTLIINIIVSIIIIFILDINLINENGIIDTNGESTDLLTVMAVIYLLGIIVSFIISFIKQKNNRSKFVPMYALIFLFTLMIIIRSIKPEIVLLSYIISYIDLIMFFTIENPDQKLVKEIVKSKEYADNSNAEKTYFIYNLSQEVKQPINNIHNILDDVLSEIKNEDAKDKLRLIDENLVQMSSIVNGVLDISSMDAHNIDTMNSNYDPQLVIKEIIMKVQNKVDKEKIEFRTVIDKNLPKKLYGDPIRFKQVLNTILCNSLKYTEKGFIELNINKVIKNNVCRLLIVVEDSGTGIMIEKLESIFKRDKKENETNLINEKDSSELNLVNVRKLLNIMGGTILINSGSTTGTKITIALDQKIVEEVKDTNIEKIVNDYQETYLNKRVLIVDDNESSITLLIKMLEKYKVDIEVATTEKESLEAIKFNKYSLVLLDDTLEKYNGIEMLKKFKEEDNYNIPTIILTRKTKLQYFDEYIESGFSDYLEKPIKKEELDKILKKFLRNK